MDETQVNGSASTIAVLNSMQGSSMVPTPASVVHLFTAYPEDIIPYNPSKSNGVSTPELRSEVHGIIATSKEGESAQASTIETVAAATTATTTSEQPALILSPPMKAQAAVLQAFESPRGFPPPTYNFADRQLKDPSNQTRRPGESLHAHISE